MAEEIFGGYVGFVLDTISGEADRHELLHEYESALKTIMNCRSCQQFLDEQPKFTQHQLDHLNSNLLDSLYLPCTRYSQERYSFAIGYLIHKYDDKAARFLLKWSDVDRDRLFWHIRLELCDKFIDFTMLPILFTPLEVEQICTHELFARLMWVKYLAAAEFVYAHRGPAFNYWYAAYECVHANELAWAEFLLQTANYPMPATFVESAVTWCNIDAIQWAMDRYGVTMDCIRKLHPYYYACTGDNVRALHKLRVPFDDDDDSLEELEEQITCGDNPDYDLIDAFKEIGHPCAETLEGWAQMIEEMEGEDSDGSQECDDQPTTLPRGVFAMRYKGLSFDK